MADTSGVRRALADAQGQLASTRAVEQRILSGAIERLKVVDARLEQLRPTTLSSRSDADAYQRLVLERGRLQETIARARARL